MKGRLAFIVVATALPACAAVTITTSATLPESTLGVYYTVTFTATNGVAPYLWQITDGILPGGLTLDPAAGVLSGTLTGNTYGGFMFTVSVRDQTGASDARTFTMIVNTQVTITYNQYLAWTVGAAYSSPVQVYGGTLPYTLILGGGALPPGLVLNAAAGNISGTPTVTGVFNFTLQATDAVGAVGTKAVTLTINPLPSITTSALPNAVVGTAYSVSLTSTGGTPPLLWYPEAALPAGLFLSSNGVLSGTPSTAGNYTVAITVGDVAGKGGTRSFPLTVSNPSSLAITTASPLPGATVGTAYSTAFSAASGVMPYNWSISGGVMPPGLSISPGGVISGSPLTHGSYTMLIQVTDATGATAVKTFAIDVAPAPVAITSGPLPAGVLNYPYSFSMTAAGGVPPYTWYMAAGSLPNGLTLDRASGVLSGAPTSAGNFGFTIGVFDSLNGRASVVCTLQVSSTLTFTTPSPLPAATVGTPYSVGLTAQGGTPPYSWGLLSGNLPAGFSLDQANGRISGLPSLTGDYNFTIYVTDNAGGAVSKSLALHVGASILSIAPAALTVATDFFKYSQALTASGGTPPYSWAITAGTLPNGLILDTAAGVISGIPRHGHTETVPITVRVTDSAAVSFLKDYALTICHPVATVVYRTQNGSIGSFDYESYNTPHDSGGVFASDPAAAQSLSGDTYAVARDHFKAVWVNVFTAATKTWGAWRYGGGVTQGNPAIAVGTNGVAYIGARDDWDSYWLLTYTPGTGFGSWIHLAGIFSTDPVMAAARDGSIYIVGKDKWNSLWSGRYIPGSGFQGWQYGAGILKGKPALTMGSDGVAYIAARDFWDSLWIARLQGNAWLGWSYGQGVMSTDPVVVAMGAGTLNIMLSDPWNVVWYRGFTEGTAAGWQSWVSTGGVLTTAAAAAASGDLYFMGRDVNGDLWWWRSVGRAWAPIGYRGMATGALAAVPR